jgi:hypothetical protein
VLSLSLFDSPELVTCDTKATLYSAAIASPAIARLSHSSGLAISENEQLQQIAGLVADVQTLDTLQELGMPLSEQLVNAVALSGRLNILQHLLTDQHCPRPSILSHYAAGSGSISMLNWLKAQSWCVFDKHTCAGAAWFGHLEALQHLRDAQSQCEWDIEHIACSAARSGDIETVKWLQQQQAVVIGAETLSRAAGAGQIAMRIGCEWDVDACSAAAESGQLDTLRWLRENGCPCDIREVCSAAADGDSTDILDYIVDQDEVLDAEMLTEALNSAGASGSLAAAKWLRLHGAQWPSVLEFEDQQWEDYMITWARAEGCTSPVPELVVVANADDNNNDEA